MQHSEDSNMRGIGLELAAAIFAVQQEVREVKKSSSAKFGKYANLSTVIEALRPSMDKAGLFVMQFPAASYDAAQGTIGLTTVLVHAKTGQYISETAAIPTALQTINADLTAQGITSHTPQGFGAAMTYARRYALVSIFNLKSEEDDAQDPDAQDSGERRPSAKPLFRGRRG